MIQLYNLTDIINKQVKSVLEKEGFRIIIFTDKSFFVFFSSSYTRKLTNIEMQQLGMLDQEEYNFMEYED